MANTREALALLELLKTGHCKVDKTGRALKNPPVTVACVVTPKLLNDLANWAISAKNVETVAKTLREIASNHMADKGGVIIG